jgi:hypothetical protein
MEEYRMKMIYMKVGKGTRQKRRTRSGQDEGKEQQGIKESRKKGPR